MRFKTSRKSVSTLLAAGGLMLVALSVNTATMQEKPVYKPTGGEATIVGTISFVGQPPKPFRIDTSADPICAKANPDASTDWVVVHNQKLANVVVYLRSESLNTYSFPAPSPDVTLEHKGCQYVPHVLGMQTQQTLKVVNSDPTAHNTHPTPKNNDEWNQSQGSGAGPLEQRFPSPELFIPIKDSQHPWEKAYVGVFSHPFFSVSSTDGSYKISGLPPGEYTVVAWHEKLGEQTVDVFLAGSELRNLDFSFKPSDH
jgi:hypothetical protein